MQNSTISQNKTLNQKSNHLVNMRNEVIVLNVEGSQAKVISESFYNPYRVITGFILEGDRIKVTFDNQASRIICEPTESYWKPASAITSSDVFSAIQDLLRSFYREGIKRKIPFETRDHRLDELLIESLNAWQVGLNTRI